MSFASLELGFNLYSCAAYQHISLLSIWGTVFSRFQQLQAPSRNSNNLTHLFWFNDYRIHQNQLLKSWSDNAIDVAWLLL
jgi:hypothetical protein